MQRTSPEVTRLSDYKPSEFLIDTLDLTIDLHDTKTLVTSKLNLKRNAESKELTKTLSLQSKALQLHKISMNGKVLKKDEYDINDNEIILKNLPDQCEVEIVTETNPNANSALKGLYKSDGNFCTHCEPDDFCRITPYPTRPDMLSVMTTTLIADEKQCPILLSNGNEIAKGKSDNGKHWIKYKDDFRKSSYLFALVAGKFECLEDYYETLSGKKIKLQIFSEIGYGGKKCEHAMKALKKAMRWDEINFGRVFDLDTYKIVAVRDFNAGAMENKGLNIFNAINILGMPETATDDDLANIERVVAHEYFHNWTGNRVTLKTWHNLTIKEGMTEFREQSFCEDVDPTRRIPAASVLRDKQFAEDAGPLAHAVRPESYVEISNLYTTTIYKKGGEVFRLLQTALGKDLFRKGMDHYFEKHDGQAVTVEEYIAAMSEGTGKNLDAYLLWFKQIGTPTLDVTDHYDPKSKIYTLKVKQSLPGTNTKPMPIPLKISLLDEKGARLNPKESVLMVDQTTCEFKFDNIPCKPTPSMLRGFSAPVKLNYAYTQADLKRIAQYDNDEFCRWDACKSYYQNYLLGLIKDYQAKKPLVISEEFTEFLAGILKNDTDQHSMTSYMLSLPKEHELAALMKTIDVEAITTVRSKVMAEISNALKQPLCQKYLQLSNKDNSGARALMNTCLSYENFSNAERVRMVALAQFNLNLDSNMTNALGALKALNNFPSKEREEALNSYYKKWNNDVNVINNWFEIQASLPDKNTLKTVETLVSHEKFDIKNPNKVTALVGTFTRNFACFHAESGEGYQFLGDFIIKLDAINSRGAAKLVNAFANWQKFDENRKKKMHAELIKIQEHASISQEVSELVSKIIGFTEVQEKSSYSGGLFASLSSLKDSFTHALPAAWSSGPRK